jgi:hypothetical protein
MGSQSTRLTLIVFGVLVVALTAAVVAPLLVSNPAESQSLPSPPAAEQEVAQVTAPPAAVAPTEPPRRVDAASQILGTTAPPAPMLALAPAARGEGGEAVSVAALGKAPFSGGKAFRTVSKSNSQPKPGNAHLKQAHGHGQSQGHVKGKGKAKAHGHHKNHKKAKRR